MYLKENKIPLILTFFLNDEFLKSKNIKQHKYKRIDKYG